MHLARLRLYGFKSFGDKTEVEIAPGLNGIVGPNGCGKSNLVEAMRWVMGGASAKNFRADDMNDVIFAGTAKRPARNIAEVSLLLDNTDNTAPHPFQNISQIEVTRRIERDKGSTYLVNGKVVRARDVAMLFADALTGANSPALVSQGKVAQLIGAKPIDRRHVLEEAAGVTSLFSRRHEAQLRLKAASENLAKLDDALRDMDSRTATLRRQAKQAERYTELNTTINQHDMALMWYGWRGARDAVRAAEAAFHEAEERVRVALTEQARLNTEATAPLENLPSLRDAEARARAALQKLRHTAESIEQQAAQRRSAMADLKDQVERVDADLAFTHDQQAAAKAQHIAIEDELKAVLETLDSLPELIAGIESDLTVATENVSRLEQSVFTLQTEKRSMESDRDRKVAAMTGLERRVTTLQATVQSATAQLEALNAKGAAHADVDGMVASRANVSQQIDERDASASTLQATLDAAKTALDAADAQWSALQGQHKHIVSEIAALERSLAALQRDAAAGVLMDSRVQAGYEIALTRAAGAAGMKAGEHDGASYWRDAAANAPAFAQGVTTLANLVDGHASKIAAFLHSVAVVETLADADALTLTAGQSVVTRDGHLRRWDGLVITPDYAEDASHTVLQYRARLESLLADRDAMTAQHTAAQENVAACRAAKDAAAAAVSANQNEVRTLRQQLAQLDSTIGAAQQRMVQQAAERATMTERLRQAGDELAVAEKDLIAAKQEQESAKDAERLTLVAGSLDRTTAELATAREARNAAQSKLAAMKADAAQADRRKTSLSAERLALFDRLAAQDGKFAELDTRKTELSERLATLEADRANDDSAVVLDGLRTRIADAERAANAAQEALVNAETTLQNVNKALREADETAAAARETRGGAVAALDAARDKLALAIADIDGRFAMEPAALESDVTALFANGIPARATCKSIRDEASKARDAIGPVNLQAAEELKQLEDSHGTIIHERADLAAAIDRLQDAISTLNSEARGRLQTAYDTINTHFQTLFQRLFGGGEARLQLVGDDILDAGLEIFAQPPGKALQSLSLLSGGEQALTALTLIFAMFACNPAPICVLDEVDAPLDDANIERVCNLLEEMSRRFTTRFMVITHHRITMARMQRLYGVTMMERGVSQLVGVDLDVLSQMEGMELAAIA